MSQIHNEQVKLLANALSTAGTSSFTVGVLAPIAAAIYTGGNGSISVTLVALAAGGWLSVAAILHLLARRVLRSLRP